VASVTLPTTLAEDVCALAPDASTRVANNVVKTRIMPHPEGPIGVGILT